MKKKTLLFLFLIALTWCTGKAYSQGLTPQNLPIEKKTNYYLLQNLECREVVKARNTTIDSLKAISVSQKKAVELVKLEAGASRRVANSLKDSVATAKAATAEAVETSQKQTRKKKNWRKAFFISSAIGLGEALIILKSFSLW